MKTFEEIGLDNLKIKDWFLPKLEIRRGFEICGIASVNFKVMQMTERAVKVAFRTISLDGEYESAQFCWIPKSCFEDVEEYDQNLQTKYSKYDELVKYAQSVIKGVRSGMKVQTILAKLEANGYSYNY